MRLIKSNLLLKICEMADMSPLRQMAANNSLERTQPQRGFKYDVAVLRRSARSR
jgi:hypothetical protein